MSTDEAILETARAIANEIDLALDVDRLEWRVSHRAKRRAGACEWSDAEAVATIVLAAEAYESFDESTFTDVVRHELIHAWEFQQFGTSGHGSRFREQAASLGVSRHCPSFSDPRYRLRCSSCDWTASRYRASKPVQSPAQYQCGACSDSIEVEHVASGRTWSARAGYRRAQADLGGEW